jgi:hypothetical protein
MPSLLVFSRVYDGLEIQSFMLVFSTPPVNTPSHSKRIVHTNRAWLWGGGRVLSCVVDHIRQEFDTLFLTRFRTYKIAPPQTKTPVKTAFKDFCL